LAENDSDGEAPTPTIGSAAVTVSATTIASTPTKVNSAAGSLNNHASSVNTLVPMAAFCTASLVAAAAGYLL
jgi:hypothetical protein